MIVLKGLGGASIILRGYGGTGSEYTIETVSNSAQYPIGIERESLIGISDFETGKEVRRQISTLPRRTVTLQFTSLKSAEVDLLASLFLDNKGSWNTFWYCYPWVEPNTGEYVGRGNGGTTIFTLPGEEIESSSLSVYVNGSLTEASFLSGGGDGGRDRVQFTTAPENGSVVTADFTGKLVMKMRFANDNFSKELFDYFLYNVGLELKEVA